MPTKTEGPKRPAITFIKNQNKSDLIGAEVGVFWGDNALDILHHLSIKKLYLIDPYIAYPEYLDSTILVLKAAEKIVQSVLGSYKNKIDWKIMMSADASHLIPPNLDFVYIDGNHAYEYVKKDILLYYPKVKKGGVFGGHDYYNQGKAREVKKAVDEFAAKNKLKLSVEGIDWWIIK